MGKWEGGKMMLDGFDFRCFFTTKGTKYITKYPKKNFPKSLGHKASQSQSPTVSQSQSLPVPKSQNLEVPESLPCYLLNKHFQKTLSLSR
jgi:hypothetical protein